MCSRGRTWEILNVVPNDPQTRDSGPLVTGLPLGGSAHIVMRRSGDFTFSSHAHDSGFDNIDYVISAVLMTPSGIAFTYQHSGHTESTSAGLPFGTPKRDDNFVTSGNNISIVNELSELPGARLAASIDGVDTLTHGLEGILNDIVKKVADQFETLAANFVVKSVIALVV